MKVDGGLRSCKRLEGNKTGMSSFWAALHPSIEPLLQRLRSQMMGFVLPVWPHTLPAVVSAYADDVCVFVDRQRDVVSLCNV